jgi:hypothetical protein
MISNFLANMATPTGFLSEISSSHGGEYEVQNLLGCIAMFLIEC